MVTLIELHQPKGDSILVNLDNVTRIWEADSGGTGMAFVCAQFNNGVASCVYKERYQDVKQILKQAGHAIL